VKRGARELSDASDLETTGRVDAHDSIRLKAEKIPHIPLSVTPKK
jgi:hypothetical protein